MEKNKEVIKKAYSDTYESKRIGISKANFFKSHTQVHPRSEDTKSRISNTSRSKNYQPSVTKKSIVYGSETKSLYKHNCEDCGIKRNSNLIVKAVSVDHSANERKLEHCHSLNGNIFNVHPSLCNLACSVPEITHLNRVLNFQSARHNELSFSKCTKPKQRTVFPEHRGYNYKNPNTSNAFSTSKFSPAAANCNVRTHCSKHSSWGSGNVDPYFNISTSETVSEGIITSDEYNLKCGLKYSTNNTISKDCENLSDLPILVRSDFSKESWEVKYSIDNKFRNNPKQRRWNSKSWGQAAISSERTITDSRAFDKTDKMLFPALPSNSHSQVKLNSSHTSSIPPSEHSSADNSDIESVNSFPDGNVSCAAPSFTNSMSLTIPQASYADVIRMSSAGVQGLIAADFEKTSEQNSPHSTSVNSPPDKLQKEESNQTSGSDWVMSRLSQLDQKSSAIVHNVSMAQSGQKEQNFGAPRPIVVSLEKPSFYNSSLQSNKNVLSAYASHSNLTSPERKVVENENLITDCLCDLDKISADKVSLLSESMQAACISDIVSDTNIQGTSLKTDSVYSSPSSIDSFCDAFKSAESSILNACNYSKTKSPPVVIMNNSSTPQSISEISFGIEYEEMVKLCDDSCDTSVKSVSSFSLPQAEECCFSEESMKSPDVKPEFPKAHVQCERSHSLPPAESSLSADQFITVKGKKIFWKDTNVDNRYNHQQMAEYFANGNVFIFSLIYFQCYNYIFI